MKRFLKTICVLLLGVGMLGCTPSNDNIEVEKDYKSINKQLIEHGWDSRINPNNDFWLEVYYVDEEPFHRYRPQLWIYVDEKTRKVKSIVYFGDGEDGISGLAPSIYLDSKHPDNVKDTLASEETIKLAEKKLSEMTDGLKIEDLIIFAEDFYKDYKPH